MFLKNILDATSMLIVFTTYLALALSITREELPAAAKKKRLETTAQQQQEIIQYTSIQVMAN